MYIDATAGKALPLFTSCSCKPSRLRILTETLLGGARSHGNSRGSGHGNVVTLWDARTLDRVDELWPVGVGKGGGGDGTVVGFSLSANLLVAATRSNFLCAWDARVWGKVLWSRMMDRQQLSGQVMDRATPSDVHAAGETPIEGVKAGIVEIHRDRPDEILISINDRDPQFSDYDIINTRTGERTKLIQNDEGFLGYFFDDKWSPLGRLKMTPEAGMLFELQDKDGWFEYMNVAMEDSMTTQPTGISNTGGFRGLSESCPERCGGE